MASFDGTWQRRGYASLNGVVSCIVYEKVVDYAVLSEVCSSCKYWKLHQNTQAFEVATLPPLPDKPYWKCWFDGSIRREAEFSTVS